MNPNHIAEMLQMVLAVNIGAMIVLVVLSYVSSVFIMNWLESLDHWLAARDGVRPTDSKSGSAAAVQHPES